ncbi:MAG: Lrp/AsnC family transcriptional regulator [Pseudomonadota bacterium]
MDRETSNLTPTDRRILNALRINSRASVTELAQTIGASRTTVKQRLDGLISSGVITRFTIDTNENFQDQVRAVTMIELQGSMSRSVIRALHAVPEITALYATNGSWDLVAEIEAAALADIDGVLRRIREIPGVLNSQTSLLLSRV